MGMFDNLEVTEEIVNDEQNITSGSGAAFGKIENTGVYDCDIEQAYLAVANSGAVQIIMSLKSGNLSLLNYEYVMSGDSKGNKPMFTFGKYAKANEIFGCGKKYPRTEKKTIMLWDKAAGKEIPQEKEVLVDFIGKKIRITGFNKLEDKYDSTAGGNTNVVKQSFEITHFIATNNDVDKQKFLDAYDSDYVNDKRKLSINSPLPAEVKAAEKKAQDDLNNPETGNDTPAPDGEEYPF
ncbi:MAG: hypothetical protein DRG78_02815 [Epsilonproteobacteria bacterium]|nr:MAG: hypothetical protein DRG78_02815 [Campylobacterota bacterium]